MYSLCVILCSLPYLKNRSKIFAQHCRFMMRTTTVVAFRFHLVLPKSILFSGLVINKKNKCMEQKTVSLPTEGVLVCHVCAYVLFFKCMSSCAKIIDITICLCHCHLFLVHKQSGFTGINAASRSCAGDWEFRSDFK